MAGALIDDVNDRTTTLGRSATTATPTIDEILAIPDPALRNVWITHAYSQLAHRLAATYGPDQTWCSFATWMSVTAGAVIRCPQLPRMVQQLFVGSEDVVDSILDRTAQRTRLRRRAGLMSDLDRAALERLVVEALEGVSERTGAHTTAAFADLAPLFERLADWLDARTPGDDLDDVDDVLDSLDVPAGDDQPLLRLAFHHLVRASKPTVGSHERAQFVLTANAAVAVYEQQIADADIATSFDLGRLTAEDQLVELLHPGFGPMRRVLANSIHDDIVEDVEDLWHHVSSRLLMSIVMPNEILHVGRDLPMLATGERFPVMLDVIDHPVLLQLMDDWDPTEGTGIGARSWEWDTLAGRVGYLFNLLRSRQRDSDLLSAPLTGGDVEAMRRGELPPLA